MGTIIEVPIEAYIEPLKSLYSRGEITLDQLNECILRIQMAHNIKRN